MKVGMNRAGDHDCKIIQRRMVMVSFLLLSGIILVYLVAANAGYGKWRKADIPQISAEITPYIKSISSASGGFSNSGSISGPAATISSGAADSGVTDSKSSIPASSYENDYNYIPVIIEPSKTKSTIDSTTSFFKLQIPALQDIFERSGFHYCEKLLDPATSTKAYIIAKNENYAQNLNGYFYYLFDEKGSTEVVSPFVLNMSILFDEENRQEVVRSGMFAEQKFLDLLKGSLSAVLGKYYSDEIYDFIYAEYKKTFSARINGEPLLNTVHKMQVSRLEVIYHNSFLTYVEFFIV